MSKCVLCNKKIKFSRDCPALNQVICSTCCGTKKVSEIKCTKDCKYFMEYEIKENRKGIVKLVKASFNKEAEDIYRDTSVLELVAPFERFMFYTYYNCRNVNDDFIFDCYMKMYYSLDEKETIYSFDEVETEIFNEYNKAAKKTKLSIESQKLILLRMMKSVDNMTGGKFGNRMYLELLRNNFTNTGIVADNIGKI